MLMPFIGLLATTTYRIVDLGIPAGEVANDVVPVAVNNRGEVAVKGKAAYLWRKGDWMPLGAPTYAAHMDGEPKVSPTAMNDFSIVVGEQGTGAPIFMSGLSDNEAFIWRGKGVESLNVGNTSSAADINGRGEVVGSIDHRGFARIKGKVWSIGTLSRVPAGNYSGAVAINDRSQILGTSTYGPSHGEDPLPSRPFLADGRRLPFRLKPVALPSGFKSARGLDLNDRGTVLAVADREQTWLPYLVSKGKVIPLPVSKGRSVGSARLNNRGDVAMNLSVIEEEYRNEPELWLEGRAVALPQFEGWTLKSVDGINDRREICGTGTFNGERRVFLLVPR